MEKRRRAHLPRPRPRPRPVPPWVSFSMHRRMRSRAGCADSTGTRKASIQHVFHQPILSHHSTVLLAHAAKRRCYFLRRLLAGADRDRRPAGDRRYRDRPSESGSQVSVQGSVVVGTLGSFPVHPGTQHLYRLTPGGSVQVAVSGLTAVLGLAFDRRGGSMPWRPTQSPASPAPRRLAQGEWYAQMGTVR